MTTLYTGLTPPDADCIHTPLIEITPVDDDAALQSAARAIDRYDYVLFTSRFAVKHFCPLLHHPSSIIHHTSSIIHHTSSIIHHPSIVSIGSTTTAALYKIGIKEVQQVDVDNSYGVIAWFRSQPCGRVLIPRSNLALPIIPEGLRELGFEVDCITAYRNQMPAHPRKICLDEVDRIVFTSPSTIDHFIRLYGSLPEGKVLVTRGPVTEQYLQTMIKQQNS